MLRKKFMTTKDSNDDGFSLKFTFIFILDLLMIPGLLVTSLRFSPIYIISLHSAFTFVPSFILYYTLKECSLCTCMPNSILKCLMQTLVKITILIGNIQVWYFGMHGGVFVTMTGHKINQMIIRRCTLRFRKRLQLTSIK